MFHDFIKIADGLMRVYEEDEVKFRQLRTSRRELVIISRVASADEIQIHYRQDYIVADLRRRWSAPEFATMPCTLPLATSREHKADEISRQRPAFSQRT